MNFLQDLGKRSRKMPLEYEDGYVPEEGFLEMHHLKTSELLKPLIGKVIKDIKMADEYGAMLVIFTDGSELDIDAEDCFNFHALISKVLSKEDDGEQLPESEHYLDKDSGDLFIINWAQNRPTGNNWVQISRTCYDNIFGRFSSLRKE